VEQAVIFDCKLSRHNFEIFCLVQIHGMLVIIQNLLSSCVLLKNVKFKIYAL
jgi:hypothetical protein